MNAPTRTAADPVATDTQRTSVGGTYVHEADHGVRDTHRAPVGLVDPPTLAPANPTATPWLRSPERAPAGAADRRSPDTQPSRVGGTYVHEADHGVRDNHRPVVGLVDPPTPAPDTVTSTPIDGAPERAQAGAADQLGRDTQRSPVGSAPNVSQVDHIDGDNHGPVVDLADPLLALAADVLDDLERVRIANENRLRQLTRSVEDSDGQERGFGLSADHPDVARLRALVDALVVAEHSAELNLRRMLRAHPLGPWVKQARGVGEKQAARLLAALGDPYWNDLHDRPRLVSELWSYAGYGDAARQVRVRGQKANWSATAKMRAYLVSVSIVKAGGPYREVYDVARAKHADAVHIAECRRCGPAGKPAQPGSPISAGHQHARALRAVSKAVLRDLWLEARRLHETLPGGQTSPYTQATRAAGEPNTQTGPRP